jgi:GNAT superfamily N-acetyltransferase
MTERREGKDRPQVLHLGREDAAEVSRVLCEAFADYPVMRHVLGPAGPDYRERLDTLVHMFVMARVFRGETLLGVPHETGLGAAALVSVPDGSESPPEFVAFRETVWEKLGPEPRARYEALGEAWSGFEVAEPHLHLNMIGVVPPCQGLGFGRALLEHVHRMSREDETSQGVTLTTEVPSNVPLYEHFGYEVRWHGHGRKAPALESWGLFRPDECG